MAIALKVLSPQREILARECQSVALPTEEGQITILPKHMPLLVTISQGELIIKTSDGKEEVLAVGGGFAQITGQEVVVLVDYGTRAEELDEQQIQAAKARAEEILQHKADDRGEAMAQASLARSLLELKVVRKRKRG